MGRLVFGQTDQVIAFVQLQLWERWGEAPEFGEGAQAIGVERGGHLVAGMVYHDWRPRNGDIMLSLAASTPMWPTRHVMRVLLGYPFCQLQVARLTCEIRSDNHACIRYTEGMGFTREGALRDYYARGVDRCFYGLLRPEWAAGRYALRGARAAPVACTMERRKGRGARDIDAAPPVAGRAAAGLADV